MSSFQVDVRTPMGSSAVAVAVAAASLSISIASRPASYTHLSILPLHTKPSKCPKSSSQAAAETTIRAPPPRFRGPKPTGNGKGKAREELYLGYETWSPAKPKVVDAPKLPTTHNAASLAYLGDCVFELYARRHFLYPPSSIDVYNERVTSTVRCESQDALLKKLLHEDFLTEEERNILRWGKNIGSSKTRTRRRAGMAVYSSASSLETLIGHLYLTDVKRLEKIMGKLGLSANA